jgi:hypothetical protein
MSADGGMNDKALTYAIGRVASAITEVLSLTIWRVVGEAATDSTGGRETWLYFTLGATTLPDLAPSIEATRTRHWYLIERVECLGEFSAEELAVIHLPDLAPIWAGNDQGRALLARLHSVRAPRRMTGEA